MAPAATAPGSWSEAAPLAGVDEAGAGAAVWVEDSTTRGVLVVLSRGVEELGVTLKVELEYGVLVRMGVEVDEDEGVGVRVEVEVGVGVEVGGV